MVGFAVIDAAKADKVLCEVCLAFSTGGRLLCANRYEAFSGQRPQDLNCRDWLKTFGAAFMCSRCKYRRRDHAHFVLGQGAACVETCSACVNGHDKLSNGSRNPRSKPRSGRSLSPTVPVDVPSHPPERRGKGEARSRCRAGLVMGPRDRKPEASQRQR